jgi:hypothetical protein
MHHGGASSLFSACAVLMLLWLVVAWPMARIEGRAPALKAG